MAADGEGAPAARLATSRSVSPRLVLACASLAQAAVSFVTFGLPSIGPELQERFELGLTGLGMVLGASFFGAGLALLGAGLAIDRFGSRLTMLVGTTLAIAGLGAAAASPSAAPLVVALVVFGLGSAVVPVAGAGALFRAYAVERRGLALGVRQMAVPAGGMASAFAFPGLEALGGVAASLLVGAAAVGVAGAAFAFVSGDAPPIAERPGFAFLRVWRAPGMGRILLVSALYILVLQAVVSYSVPAARAAGLSAFAAAATFFTFNATAFVARLVWGRLSDRGGGARRRRTLVEVGGVAALGAVLFTLALHGGTAIVLAAAAVFGFGAMGWNALVYLSAGEASGGRLANQSVALVATVIFLLSAASAPPLGALAEHAGWDVFWLTSGALALCGAVVALGLPRDPLSE